MWVLIQGRSIFGLMVMVAGNGHLVMPDSQMCLVQMIRGLSMKFMRLLGWALIAIITAASTLAALGRIGIKWISGRKHWKLEYADIRMPMSKTLSDYRSAQNCALDMANRCFGFQFLSSCSILDRTAH